MVLVRTLCFCASLLLAGAAHAQQDAPSAEEKILRSLTWIKGPQSASAGAVANFNVPKDYVFLDATDSKRFLVDVTKNLAADEEYVFAPNAFNWWGTFLYEASGHIADDEKLDSDELLKNLRERQNQANQLLRQRGLPTLTIVGWKVPPFYDAATRRLDWAIELTNDKGGRTINYHTRLLSREGNTSATLVVSPAELDAAIPEFKAAVASYQFAPGQTYTEFKQGDKIAQYGLAALIAGGAAAVATKKGFWAAIGGALAAFWKVIAAAAVAIVAAIGKLFGRKKAE